MRATFHVISGPHEGLRWEVPLLPSQRGQVVAFCGRKSSHKSLAGYALAQYVVFRDDKNVSALHADFTCVATLGGELAVGVRDCGSSNGTSVYASEGAWRADVGRVDLPKGATDYTQVAPHAVVNGGAVRLGNASLVRVQYHTEAGAAPPSASAPPSPPSAATGGAASTDDTAGGPPPLGMSSSPAPPAALTVEGPVQGRSAARPRAPSPAPGLPPRPPLQSVLVAQQQQQDTSVYGPAADDVIMIIDDEEEEDSSCAVVKIPEALAAPKPAVEGGRLQARASSPGAGAKEGGKKKRGRADQTGGGSGVAAQFDEPPMKLPAARVGKRGPALLSPTSLAGDTQEESPGSRAAGLERTRKMQAGGGGEGRGGAGVGRTAQAAAAAVGPPRRLAALAQAGLPPPRGASSAPCRCSSSSPMDPPFRHPAALLPRAAWDALAAPTDADVASVYATCTGEDAADLVRGLSALLAHVKRVRDVCGAQGMRLAGPGGGGGGGGAAAGHPSLLLPPSALLGQGGGGGGGGPSLLDYGRYGASSGVEGGGGAASTAFPSSPPPSQGYLQPPWHGGALVYESGFAAGTFQGGGGVDTGGGVDAASSSHRPSASAPASPAPASPAPGVNAGGGALSSPIVIGSSSSSSGSFGLAEPSPLPTLHTGASTPELSRAMLQVGMRPGERAYMLEQLGACGVLRDLEAPPSCGGSAKK